jgi:hypothetical protein
MNKDSPHRKQEEDAQKRQCEELIRAQKLAIAELSTPLREVSFIRDRSIANYRKD